MKKFIPAAFIVLLIWNLALIVTFVNHISEEESDSVNTEENVQVKNYLTDVTSVVSENCSSLVKVTGFFEDRENTASGITYALADGITYIFTPYITFDSGKQLEGQTGFGVVSSTEMFRTSILSRFYTDMIAIDTKVNEGNNGGVLCNIHGDLLGILVSTPFEGNEELGYAFFC